MSCSGALPPRLKQVLLGLLLVAYVLLGFATQSKWGALKPFDSDLHDYRVYDRSLDAMLSGRDPYAIRRVENGFLYPPPSLLLLEPFRILPTLQLRGLSLSLLSAVLMIVMLVGIARLYGIQVRRVWFWFPLALGFAPFFTMIRAGQIDMLTQFGIFLLFWAELSRPIISGLGFGIAVLTKVSPLLFGFYLVLMRRWYALGVAVLFLLVISAVGLLRYGPGPFLTYPDVMRNLLSYQPMGRNSQIVSARLAFAAGETSMFLKQRGSSDLAQAPHQAAALVTANRAWIQRGISIYLFLLIALSGIAAVRLQTREPFFLVTALSMVLAANVLWYHHYIFLLLPFAIWMAWRKLELRVVAWCFVVLFIVQVDRWTLTYGLLNQLVLHLTLLIILVPQLIAFSRSFATVQPAQKSA